jgi:hypothetical protein
MIDFQTAIRQALAAGIPLHRLRPILGDAYDYQDHPDVPKSVEDHGPRGGQSWTEANDDILDWIPYLYPEIATRRWVELDDSPGADEYGSFRREASKLEQAGWDYQGSGVYRIEVDPATCPVGPENIHDDAWRAPYEPLNNPTPREDRDALDRAEKEAYKAARAASDKRVQEGTASLPEARQYYVMQAMQRSLEQHLLMGAVSRSKPLTPPPLNLNVSARPTPPSLITVAMLAKFEKP